MKIRHATPDDLPELVRMGRAFHSAWIHANVVGFDDATFQSAIAHLSSSATGVVLVAEDDACKVRGMAGATASRHWFSANHITGQEMFWWVDECARGTRAGLMLLHGLESWAKYIGCNTFTMASTTNLSPEKLARLYKRLGYEPFDIQYSRSL